METNNSSKKTMLEPFHPDAFSVQAMKEQLNRLNQRKKHTINSQSSCDDVSPVRSSNNSTCLSPQADTNKRERPYKCQTCDQSFTQISNLRRHERIHNGEKPYTCSVCEKKFSTSSNLKQHFLVHTTKSDRTKISCQICGNSYYYSSSLKKHMKHHLNQPKREKNSKSTAKTDEDPVSKKQFVTPTNVTIPSLKSMTTPCQKEDVLNLLNFWDTNCREWLSSKLAMNPLNLAPLTVFNPFQFMSGVSMQQLLQTPLEASILSPITNTQTSNDSLNLSAKQCKSTSNNAEGDAKETRSNEKGKENNCAKAEQASLRTSHSSESHEEKQGLEKIEHRILVPKPIKPTIDS